MDYSSFYPQIIYLFMSIFIFNVILFIIIIYWDIHWIKQYLTVKTTKELSIIIILTIMLLLNIYFSKDKFKDIPNIINKRYVVSNGIALTLDSNDERRRTRGIKLKKEDGEILNINVIYSPIYEGDRFEVIYLPNTGIGAIIKKIENEGSEIIEE